MTDPLSLLRNYKMNKKNIVESDGQIIFCEISWPKSVKTNFIKYGTRDNNQPTDYYTLECLLYFLKYSYLNHIVYIRQAAIDNIPSVRKPDRKLILEYLYGQTTCCPSIDESAPIAAPNRVTEIIDDYPSKKHHFEYTSVESLNDSTIGYKFKSLSDVMPAEKIAAIKKKRLAIKSKNK